MGKKCNFSFSHSQLITMPTKFDRFLLIHIELYVDLDLFCLLLVTPMV